MNKNYVFLFKFGCQVNDELNKFDLVLFDSISNPKLQDIRVDEYVRLTPSIKIIIKKEPHTAYSKDFSKLYLISNVSGVNLPRLDTTQKEIVETIDKNILVQGVAGSGKTNICIDKIIFTACKILVVKCYIQPLVVGY